jgi:SAM-dependent methyltransferase
VSASGFTGERPGRGEHFDYDEARHLAAYEYAATLAAGRKVLDAGCGEGFATRTLVGVAAEVVGVDYSAEAIAYCRRTWHEPRLRFAVVDLARPGSFDERFDLVLNFQVLEHIADPIPFLEGLRARLAPAGELLLTTPNRLKSFSENPYHVREYTAAELAELLGRVFRQVRILGMYGNERVVAFDRGRERAVNRILRLDPLGLRHLLPQAVVKIAFAKLAVLVRRSARESSGDERIAPADFSVREGSVDEALDLVALCRA